MPPKKRKTTQTNELEPQIEDQTGEDAGAAANRTESRRQKDADIARKRAAHFATFHVGDSEDQSNGIHAGGSSARELGPWSSAVQLQNAREEEKEKRKGKLLDQARATKETVLWKPSRDPRQGERSVCHVPLLSHLATRLVVDHISDVETLWGLPDQIKTQIAKEACRRRVMTPDIIHLFVENSPTEVVIPDCSAIDPEAMLSAMLDACTAKLVKLDLGFCGKGFNDTVAESLATSGSRMSSITHLALTGAYKLSDQGVLGLLRKITPSLTSLSLSQCSRIEGPCIGALPELAPNLKHLDVAECRGVSKSMLLEAIQRLPQLESLILKGNIELDDELLFTIVQNRRSLISLDISSCLSITDAGLKQAFTVGTSNESLPLRRLILDECTNAVTNETLECVAKMCPKLEDLSLKRCIRVNNTGVESLVAHCNRLQRLVFHGVTTITNDALLSIKKSVGVSNLTELDVSWCRSLTPDALGLLVDASPSLKKLVMWGCTQITTTNFLWCHSNDNLVVIH